MAISRLTLFRLASVATLGWLATRKTRLSKRRVARAPAMLSSELVEAAHIDAASSNRSVADQLDRWIHMGRFYDELSDVDYDRIQLALVGALSPDDLNTTEGAVYHSALMHRMRRGSAHEESFLADLERKQRAANFDMSQLGT